MVLAYGIDESRRAPLSSTPVKWEGDLKPQKATFDLTYPDDLSALMITCSTVDQAELLTLCEIFLKAFHCFARHHADR